MSKRRSPKSGLFVVFAASIPAWFVGCPWGGSRAQKHIKMEARTWIFCYNLGPCFHFLWRLFEIFAVFREQQIDSTRCSVYRCLCLGLGGKPTVDASQMPPRCLPDASQMRLRCLPDASQMLPRCFPDASQMPFGCLPHAS